MSSHAAATWTIVADQGKTLDKTIRYGARVSGVFVPFDNTGWSARAMWRKTYGSAIVVSLTSGVGGGITLGGANGEIQFVIAASVTAGMQGSYVFDLELFQGTPAVVKAPVRGTTIFRAEVTA